MSATSNLADRYVMASQRGHHARRSRILTNATSVFASLRPSGSFDCETEPQDLALSGPSPFSVIQITLPVDEPEPYVEENTMQDYYAQQNTRSDPYALASQEDRCAPRSKVAINASLRPSGGRSFQTMVQDLSLSGFSATSVIRLHPGNMVWLSLPGLESLQAEVVWWENSMVGCAFHSLMNPIVLDNVLNRAARGY